jgi:hypothetical protein
LLSEIKVVNNCDRFYLMLDRAQWERRADAVLPEWRVTDGAADCSETYPLMLDPNATHQALRQLISEHPQEPICRA